MHDSINSDALERQHRAHLASLPLSETEAAERLPSVRQRVERVYTGLRARTGNNYLALDRRWGILLASLGGEAFTVRLKMLERFEAELLREREKLDAEAAEAAASQAKAAAERHAAQNSTVLAGAYLTTKEFRVVIRGITMSFPAGMLVTDRDLIIDMLHNDAPVVAVDPAHVMQCPHCRMHFEAPKPPEDKPPEPKQDGFLTRRRKENGK